jgi:hypothetical protein
MVATMRLYPTPTETTSADTVETPGTDHL